MGYPIALTGGNGIPFKQIEQVIETRYIIGRSLSLRDLCDFKGALPRKIEDILFLISQPYDIPSLFIECFDPSLLVAIDRACGKRLKVIYLEMSLYKRFRLAIEAGQRQEDFMNFECMNVAQEIIKSRADLIFNLDEWFFSPEKSKVTLEEKLERKIASLGIHSTKVRNANNHNQSTSTAS